MAVATVTCHVELPLDDRIWEEFDRLQDARPGNFAVTALLRPPDADAGESEAIWLDRASRAAARAPLGHHSHFGGPQQARPTTVVAADQFRSEVAWLRANGLAPRFYCGGGWYMDRSLAVALAEHGYVDCTATSFLPSYLEPGSAHLRLAAPSRLRLGDGGELLEFPSTHSIGMAARSLLGPLPRDRPMHVYFHDWDLRDVARRRLVWATLRLLGRRARATQLDEAVAEFASKAAAVEVALA
jgi:hypothetical protein